MINFKRLLFPVAIAWTIVNLLGLGFAVAAGEAAHAGVHALLAIAFAWWAKTLRTPAVVQLDAIHNPQVEMLENEISELRRELEEKREGLDFAEKLLEKRPEERRVDRQ